MVKNKKYIWTVTKLEYMVNNGWSGEDVIIILSDIDYKDKQKNFNN